MKLNKYIPSIGFFILLFSIVITFKFFYWVQNATYNLVKSENQANLMYARKEYQSAYNLFVKIAKSSEKSDAKSRRYRCAANAAHALNKIDIVLDMLKKALKANPNNQNAVALLDAMKNANQITQQDIDKLGVDYR